MGFEYAVESDIDPGTLEWTPLPAHQASLTLSGLDEGPHTLHIRAIDDEDAVDPSPVAYEFTTDASLRPPLTVDTNFHPGTCVFEGRATDRDLPVFVYENERLVFTVASDASSYCGMADSVAISVGDSTTWSRWHESPHEFVLRPTAGDTVVFFATQDENGAMTTGGLSLRTVPAPMDRPLLHVDDWWIGEVPEAEHDAFYDDVLSGDSCDTWDPFEHIVDFVPTLPSMDELGRYRTVLWTLDRRGGFLHPLQAESAYHYLEGFVRAGGNVILEGQSSLSTLRGADQYSLECTFEPGDFAFDHVGVDSLRNSGSSTIQSYPERYGYAFLGGIATGSAGLPDVPVDTLVKWQGGYEEHGGLPFCEIVRPLPGTRRLYLFDSYLNPNLSERPCATVRHADDETGSFAYFGFPLYYLETEPAAEMLELLLDSIEEWREPASLSYFVWDTRRDSIEMSWHLTPAARTRECRLERSTGSEAFRALNDGPILPDLSGRYEFVDRSVEPSTDYSYRLAVSEQWGATTTHGPWQITTANAWEAPWLRQPSPNPFSESLTLHYGVAADHRWVSVGVFDVAGRLVRTLREGPAQAGEYDATWDGTTERGDRVGSGVYFVRVRVGPETLERKVVLLN